MEHTQFFLLSEIRATTKASPFALPPLSLSCVSYNMVASGFMNNPTYILPFHFLLPLLKSVLSLVFTQLFCNEDGNYWRIEDNELNSKSKAMLKDSLQFIEILWTLIDSMVMKTLLPFCALGKSLSFSCLILKLGVIQLLRKARRISALSKCLFESHNATL
jgi:hypothetical protein